MQASWNDTWLCILAYLPLTAVLAPPEIRDPFSQNTDPVALFESRNKIPLFVVSSAKGRNP